MRFDDHGLPFASGTAIGAVTADTSGEVKELLVRLAVAVVSGLATTCLYNLGKWVVGKVLKRRKVQS